LDVVSISQATEFFLSGGIPGIETDLTQVGMEGDRVNFSHRVSLKYPKTQKHRERWGTFNTKSSDVFLLKLTGKMSLDKSCLFPPQLVSFTKTRLKSKGKKIRDTFPVPPSPTRTSLKVGIMVLSSMLFSCLWTCWVFIRYCRVQRMRVDGFC